MTRVAVVVPARTCPCRQAASVYEQLRSDDQLLVFLNGTNHPGHHCGGQILPGTRWLSCSVPVGPAAARNAGVNALKDNPKVLLFCDADDQVCSNWVSELSRRLLDGSSDLVGGPLRVKHKTRSFEVYPEQDFWNLQSLFGSNLGLTFFAWDHLNGFDERFRRSSEDTDLAWRAQTEGLKVSVVTEAIVDYSLRSTLSEVSQRFQWGRSSVMLLEKHRISLDHLPGLKEIIDDKAHSGFARIPITAAIAQWVGEYFEVHL